MGKSMKNKLFVLAVAASYEAVKGEQAKYQSWQPVSDARWYQDAGVPMVLIGPGDYRVAHTLNEYIELDEILPALKLYALATMDRLGYE